MFPKVSMYTFKHKTSAEKVCGGFFMLIFLVESRKIAEIIMPSYSCLNRISLAECDI